MNETNSFDLHIGIQQIKYEIPSNFKYTKFCAIKPGKLFQSNYFQMTNLIAAGTLEGPILIYTDNFETLSHVCILCAHTSSITDIIQMENNYFVSASCDGTIVKWSNDDCSHISSFPRIAENGDVLLSLYHSNPHFIFVNAVGFSTFLFDLETGIKIRSFDIFGITQVSFLHPDKCLYIPTPCLAILKFNLFSLYNDPADQSIADDYDEPIFKYAINLGQHQTYFLSEYGLFKTQNRDWELLSPYTMEKLLSGRVKKRISHDFISNIKWTNQTTFCISTYGSRFVVYNLEIFRNYGTAEPRLVSAIPIISPIESVCKDFLFFSINSTQNQFSSKFLFDSKKVKLNKTQSTTAIKYDNNNNNNSNNNNNNNNNDPQTNSLQALNANSSTDISNYRIVLSPKPKCIYSLKVDGTFSINFFNRRPKLYHVPRASSARIIETNGGCVFYVRNWEKGGNSNLKHTCKSRITSLLSRESQKLKLEIIAGCANGTVSFFSENTSKPFHTEIVLSSPIIGLAHLPLKYHGRPTMLAIGNDGSAALIKNNRVIMLYANFMMKVDSAFYHEVDQCIILHRIDSSFIVFKIDEPGPVLLTSLLPKGSMLIWSLNEMQNEAGVYNNNYYRNLNLIPIKSGLNMNSDSALTTNYVRFGINSWFYASVGISNFLNVQHRRYKLFAKFLMQLFQPKTDGPFPHSQSLTFSKVMNEISNSAVVTDDSDLDSDYDDDVATTETTSSSSIAHFNSAYVNSKTKRFNTRFLNANSSSTLSDPVFQSHPLPLPLPLPLPPSPIASPLNQNPGFSQFPKSQSIQSLVDWISPAKPSMRLRQSRDPYQKIIEGLSLVIVGSNKKTATFFFPDFRICGNMAFILSDKNSVNNMIIKTLISGETSEEQHPELIQAFAKLLSCGNYNIEMAASIECDRLIGCVTNEIAQNLIKNVPPNSHSKSHLFIESIVAFTRPNLVQRRKYQELLSFLVMMTMSRQGSASLALSILIRGFEFWSTVNSNSKSNLFVKLIDCFIRIERPKALEEIFFSTAIDNLDDFFDAMKKTINMNYYSNFNSLKKLIDLFSKIAFSDPQRCGTQIAAMLVDIASQFDQMIPFIADEIGTYSIFFTSVSIVKNVIVIGGKNGFISVYKNFKMAFSERAFNSEVDYVSIGPSAQFCAAISVSEGKAIIFSLQPQGIMNSFHKRSGIETNLERVGGHYKIFWSDPSHCHFSFAD